MAELESQPLSAEERAELEELRAEMTPKASYYDVVLNCKDLVAISVISKDYGWSAKRMNKWLHEKGIQFRQPSGIRY